MQAFDVPAFPLVEDASGVMRISGTRVPLEVLVTAFDCGATPEEIVVNHPTLTLPQVYAIIAYALQNRPRIDAYMAARQAEADVLRTEIEARLPAPIGFRDRLLARRATTKSE